MNSGSVAGLLSKGSSNHCQKNIPENQGHLYWIQTEWIFSHHLCCVEIYRQFTNMKHVRWYIKVMCKYHAFHIWDLKTGFWYSMKSCWHRYKSTLILLVMLEPLPKHMDIFPSIVMEFFFFFKISKYFIRALGVSLYHIHIWRGRRYAVCRYRWSPYN